MEIELNATYERPLTWAEECEKNRNTMYALVKKHSGGTPVQYMSEDEICDVVLKCCVEVGSLPPTVLEK